MSKEEILSKLQLAETVSEDDLNDEYEKLQNKNQRKFRQKKNFQSDSQSSEETQKSGEKEMDAVDQPTMTMIELANTDNNTACFKKDDMNTTNSSTYDITEEQINDEQAPLGEDGFVEELQDSSEAINAEVEDKITRDGHGLGEPKKDIKIIDDKILETPIFNPVSKKLKVGILKDRKNIMQQKIIEGNSDDEEFLLNLKSLTEEGSQSKEQLLEENNADLQSTSSGNNFCSQSKNRSLEENNAGLPSTSSGAHHGHLTVDNKIKNLNVNEKLDFLIALQIEQMSENKNNRNAKTCGHNLTDEDILKIESILPIRTESTFLKLNRTINNDGPLKRKFLAYMKSKGNGKDPVKDVIYSILRAMISKELGSQYSGKGRKGKKSFENTPFFRLLSTAMYANYKISCEKVLHVCSLWLKARPANVKYHSDKTNRREMQNDENNENNE